ncbi:hypothetical protein LZ554_007937 [Drepanopeziza brunnea f. sp. 'monogermtubi']|nr:hypothetical protein LZ554_007937 [Drepanopeziza brunnea f. sp. 'monogermtubi']
MKCRPSILVLAFLPVVSALALSNGPAIATAGRNLVKDSSAPSPTSAPDNELRCRQDLQSISLVGPDAICDYIEANASHPWRCQPQSSSRAFATATLNIAKCTVQALPASSTSSPSPSTSNSPLTTSPSIQIKATPASAIQPFGDGGKTSSAKGPIIGSIVGGSFGLVLIAAAVFFIYLRCKTSRRG